MDSGAGTFTPPDSPPRFIAAFYDAQHGWRIAAEAPARGPVDYAAAEMVRTVQSRGQLTHVEIWGPGAKREEWRLLDTLTPGKRAGSAPGSVPEQPQRSARDERLRDRRHQVLTSALARSGVDVSQPVDDEAVSAIVDALEEEPLRRLALWLSQANNAA
ncbi:hypothetical protein ABZ684_30925 [Streptomyces sp. NPDC006995]|uniref:hypothetical protein n=1 Tax=Streptomyces sp. NPDC006995 TaxID=3156907 RepID=UPI0033F26E90